MPLCKESHSLLESPSREHLVASYAEFTIELSVDCAKFITARFLSELEGHGLNRLAYLTSLILSYETIRSR